MNHRPNGEELPTRRTPSEWTPTETSTLTIAAFLASSALLAPQPAAAHPHMYFDAQAVFHVDDQRRLTQLDVAFVVDEFNTLYIVADLGLDADGDGALSGDEPATLSDAMRIGLGDYGYFTELRVDETAFDIAAPRDVVATLQEGRIAARLTYAFNPPIDVEAAAATLALFDPTYFTAVTMAAAPVVLGNDACAATFTPFEATAQLAQTQELLARLGREETPEDASIGALFADRAVLRCAG